MKTQNKQKSSFAVGIIITLILSLFGPAVPVAEAALTGVGPVLDPVNDGYPQWYSDENGLALQLCLDQGPLGLCVLTPEFDPLDPALPNPATPIGTVASGIFPDESFYWIADAILDPGVRLVGANTDIKITYRAALEQAFLSGIVPGTQNIFLRVQTDINGLVPNETYTVTHPYGTMTVTADATGGGRTRFEDLGSCVTLPTGLFCTFADPSPVTNPVLASQTTNVGAFLQWNPQDLPLAPAGFIGDPNVAHRVIGGRGGVNSLTVTGTNVGGVGINTLSTDLFNVSGKLADTIPPVITLNGNANVIVRQGAVYNDAGATALDNFDGDITARITVTGLPVDTNTVGIQTVTYRVVDAAGNVTTAQRTVDVQAPVATTVSITPANSTIQTGTNQQFTAQILDQFGIAITGTVTWSSSNLVVGIINGTTGLFNSVAAGATVITATAGTVSGTTNLTIQDPVLTTINVTPSALTTSVTAQTTFTAVTLDQFGNPIVGVVTWLSANPGIGTINANTGVFTAVAPGTVNITASSGAVTAGVSVTVQPQVLTTINITPATLSAGPAQTQQFTAAPLDQLGNPMTAVVTWSSSNPLVGTITAGGLFSAVGEGTTVITATSGTISGTATVVVGPLALTTINVTPNPVTITTLSQQFTAATLDQLGNPFPGTVTWSSSNPAVGSINPTTGVFTVVGAGTATITATSGTVSGTATATVQATLTTINVTPATITINATENTTFTAAAFDQFSNPMTAVVTWTSSAPLVGTINASGVFSGLTGGTATITATSGTVTGTATVTVAPLVITTINVTPATASLIVTQTQQFTAATLDQLGGPIAGAVTWTSSNPLVGTINATGLFTALTEGTATITATSGTVTGTATVTVGPLAVTTINVTPLTATITGLTQQFTAATLDQLGNPFAGTVTWSSSNPAVGTVDANGLFTASGAGTATITATSGTASGTATITVTATLTAINVTPATITINATESTTFAAATLDQFSNPMTAVVTWTSSAPLVGTINASGVFTSLSAGTATITATSGTVSGTATVTVAPLVLTTINVTPATNSLVVGQTRQLAAATLDQLGGAIAGAVTWTSSNTTIATVSAAGLVTAVAEGNATITATSGTVSGTATITVGPLAATTISVTPLTATITGNTQQFTAAALDQLGNPFATTFTWTSSNNAVGTINATGLFTALSAGTVTITATSGTASGTATLTVQANLTTITVTPATKFVVINRTGTLTAAAVDQFGGAMSPAITWTSSNPLVASVDASGVVTGVALGTATITAANGLISDASLITVVDIPLSVTFSTPGQWAIFSAPRQLASININIADFDSILTFDGVTQRFIQITDVTNPLLKDPLSAFFVKPNKVTTIDFTLATQPDPGLVTKALGTGWNLVSTNNPGLAENELSSIQVTNQVDGIVTLNVPQTFNARKDIFSDWGLNAEIDLNANPITVLPDMSLSEVDGYWINMNGPETFSKINQ